VRVEESYILNTRKLTLKQLRWIKSKSLKIPCPTSTLPPLKNFDPFKEFFSCKCRGCYGACGISLLMSGGQLEELKTVPAAPAPIIATDLMLLSSSIILNSVNDGKPYIFDPEKVISNEKLTFHSSGAEPGNRHSHVLCRNVESHVV
jgi:hypothetical protein